MRKKIEERKLLIEVDSAGTADYHVGESPDKRAIAAARNFGVDISNLRGRQFTERDFDRFDRIFAMDTSNYKNIQRLTRNENDKQKVFYFWNEGNKGMDVPDPWFGDAEGFYPVYELLDTLCDKILEKIKTEVKL